MEFRVTLSDYSQDLLKYMYHLQRKGTLCDAGLECKDGLVYVHQVIIMSCESPYLQEQLSAWDNSVTKRCNINLNQYSLKTVYDLVKTLYTGMLQVTDETLEEMKDLCSFLSLKKLSSAINVIVNKNQRGSTDTGVSPEKMYVAEIIKAPSGTFDDDTSVVDSTCDNEEPSVVLDHGDYCGSPSTPSNKRPKISTDRLASSRSKRKKLFQSKEPTFNNENYNYEDSSFDFSDFPQTDLDNEDLQWPEVVSRKPNAICEVCNAHFWADKSDPKNIVCLKCRTTYSGDKRNIQSSGNKKYICTKRMYKYSAEAMRAAYNDVKDKKMRVYEASNKYGVPLYKLQKALKGNLSDIDSLNSGKVDLNHSQAAKLADFFVAMDKLGYAYSRADAWKICDEFAIMERCRERGTTLGARWWYSFLNNFPELLEIRKKLGSFIDKKLATLSYTTTFYTNLKTALSASRIKEVNIFNVVSMDLSYDEPYFITETRDISTQTITMFGCGNAGGGMLLPYYIFPSNITKTMEELKNDCSPGSCMVPTEEMFACEIFLKYLQDHFIKYTSTDQRKIILIDGHNLYISVSVLEWAEENNISIVVLPGRSGKVIQPVEVDCLPSFACYFKEECENVQIISKSCLDRSSLCKAAYKAYTKAFSRENLINGFKTTSVYPINVSWL